MHTSTKSLILILVALLVASSINAQYRKRGWEKFKEGLSITPKGGYNMFFGDLVDESRGSFSLGAMAEKELTETLSARTQLIGGMMQGTQVLPTSNQVYASFENTYVEFTVGGAYRPLNQILGYFKQRKFQPYAHLNLGLVYFNATEYWGSGSGNPDGEVWRKAAEMAPVITAGGGTSYWITPIISANLELTGALPFTDRMDVHDEWYDGAGNTHVTDDLDFYYTLTAGITILLKESRLKNDPRYNRRAYLKMRSFYQYKSSKRNSFSSKSSRRR
jgi:hypothetical protein